MNDNTQKRTPAEEIQRNATIDRQWDQEIRAWSPAQKAQATRGKEKLAALLQPAPASSAR